MLNIKKIKPLISGLIIGGLLTVSSFAIANNPISIFVNNERLKDANAVVIEGRTYVPLRVIANSLGAEVEWDNVNSAVIITNNNEINNNSSIKKINDSTILYNGNYYYELVEWANKHNISKNDINYDSSNHMIILIKENKKIKVDNINAIMQNGIIYLKDNI